MENFIKLLLNTYDDKKKISYITEVLNASKNKPSNHIVYDFDFVLSVGTNVISNKMDIDSVIVAILYGLTRGGMYDLENVTDEEYLTKINALYLMSKLEMSTRQDTEISLNKMFLSMAKDIRVMIIKLCIEAEKLNILGRLNSKQKDDLMRSQKDVYSPIASMLGISKIKDAMEDATFKYYNPKMYKELEETINTYVAEGIDKINDAVNRIRDELQPSIPNVKVYGRQKKLASIAKKLQKKKMGVDTIASIYGENGLEEAIESKSFKDIKFSKIVDILALRVLVNSVEECYMVLGKIFSIFTPIGNFKDYISHPKENGYQSLHTLVMLDDGSPLEIQVRTFDMHTFAEYGLASHWAYKAKTSVQEADMQINYVRQILDYYKDKPNNEILEAIKTDFYNGMIYVQTPMGKLMELPEGSTPIDFAYAIHSNIGDKCVGAKVNDVMVPLNTILQNGDVVNILTNVNSKGPSRDWLKFVKGHSTKSKINYFFKKQMKEDNIKKGKSIIEEQAKTLNLNLSKLLNEKYLKYVFERYSLSSIDDMYATVGYGGLTSSQILNKLNTIYKELEGDKDLKPITIVAKPTGEYKHDNSVEVLGYTDMFVKYAKCCNALPGDEIIGYISRGNGVTIHRTNCAELKNCEFERLVECHWTNRGNIKFIGRLNIIMQDKAGALANISKKISDLKINILSISSNKTANNNISLKLQVEVKEKEQLDELIQKLNNFSFVNEIIRN